MIISASRRTDIPAFYADWFFNRLHAGYCLVGNPFAPSQSSRVSLARADVDCIVFWTRHPAVLARRAVELRDLGHQAVCLTSITNYPRAMEPARPATEAAVKGVLRLAQEWGASRIVWRYDPIVLTESTPPEWHLHNFKELAGRLAGAVVRVKTSLFEGYRKTRSRMAALERQGFCLFAPEPERVRELLFGMKAIARTHGMELQACAQGAALADCGIPAGACIDAAWLGREFNISLPLSRDSHQRGDCLCAQSRDVGAYDTCCFGCAYCYATASPARARANRALHDPAGHALLPLAAPRKERGCQQGLLPL